MRLVLSAAIVAALPLAAIADDLIDDSIEGRQGYFKMLSLNMGTLAGMAKGEVAYDETAASTAAANIETLSNYHLSGLFVAGSSTDDIDTTAAKADIWSDAEGFTAKYAALTEAAAGAGEAVKGGQGNVGPVVAKLGATCKACHDSYRVKR